MNLPYEMRIGWRYTRTGRAGRRNGFISFISGVSMLGIALGVAALIIVLSVMNGFQKEVRDRMLSAIPHVELFDAGGEPLQDWQAVAAAARKDPRVKATAPFVESQALVARGDVLRGVQVRGVLPSQEIHITPLADRMKDAMSHLSPGSWNVVIGARLARELGVREGDVITLVTPSAQMTPAGGTPRLRQVTVAGIFFVDHFQYDSTLVLMDIEDAARLFQTGGPMGVQLRLADQQEAREVAAAMPALVGERFIARDWTRTNAEWYDAVQIEKRMMFIILTLIVAVAAFNLVSTLVMTVTDKQSDIAILRTLGASPRSVMGIFMVQGATSGVIGTLAGVLLGLLVAFNVDPIVRFIEALLHVKFLPSSVYLITNMPSDPQAGDIVPIAVISLVLAFAATVYPSWRASRVQPAQALRYE